MPQKALKYDSPKQDGRRKIMPEDHPKIIALYKEIQSQRKVAKIFGISRSHVAFITQPEKYEAHKKAAKEKKVHLAHYQKERHREYMQTYREKKRKLHYMEIKSNPPLNKDVT